MKWWGSGKITWWILLVLPNTERLLSNSSVGNSVNGRKPGSTPKKLVGNVQPASRNPYSISDQNLRFPLPCFRSDQNFDTLFQTFSLISSPMHKLYPIPKSSNSMPYFRPKRLKNHNLLGYTYLYCPHKEFPRTPGHIRGPWHVSRLQNMSYNASQ